MMMLKAFKRLNHSTFAKQMLTRSYTNSAAIPQYLETSLEDDLRRFTAELTVSNDLSISRITDLMDRSFIDRHFSFEEH